MRCAALDLGSNSFHVLVADLDGHRLSPVLRSREMLHLGRTVAQHGAIPAEARRATVETVAHLAELARRSGAEELLAVATAALREARNGEEVLAELTDAAGAPVRVLTGDEEARLSYLGVRGAVAVHAEPVVVLDLGGGSLELAVGHGSEVQWATSLPLGVSRLSAAVEHDPISDDEVAAIEAVVDRAMAPVVADLRDHLGATTIAVGGTVRALARMAAEAEQLWLPATLNQLRLSRTALSTLRDRLLSRDLDGRLQLPVMKTRRADHLHVAAIVLVRVLEHLELSTTVISDWGLREGLLFEAHGVSAPPDPAHLRDSEVARVRETFVPDDPHAQHVANLADQLFRDTRSLHGLGDLDGELLHHAACLHSIGEAVALRRQHQHGAYLLEHAELRGFDPTESAVLLTLVRFHPSRGIGPDFPPYASLDTDLQDRVQRLLALLQLADGLDRARDQAVTEVHAHTSDGRVELTLEGGGLHVTQAELAGRTRAFCRTFGVEVTVIDRGRTDDEDPS